MPMLSQLPFVKFVISADEPLILNIHGCCLLSLWEEWTLKEYCKPVCSPTYMVVTIEGDGEDGCPQYLGS